jgi:hypothetical protein
VLLLVAVTAVMIGSGVAICMQGAQALRLEYLAQVDHELSVANDQVSGQLQHRVDEVLGLASSTAMRSILEYDVDGSLAEVLQRAAGQNAAIVTGARYAVLTRASDSARFFQSRF